MLSGLLFLIVSNAIAFADGYYLISWGLDWLVPTAGISVLVALLCPGVLELLVLDALGAAS